MHPPKRRHDIDKWDELGKIFGHYMNPNEAGHITHKLQFHAACVEEITVALESLTQQIKKDSEASDRLSGRVFWLNVILALLTFVGALFTVLSFFKAS